MSRLALAFLFFFLSGATGLIYESLWTRRLSLTFGHTVLAVSTVLTAYMLGLALGSLLGGAWVDRRTRQGTSSPVFLRTYGILEALVGIWAVASLPLLDVVENVYLRYAKEGSAPLVAFAGSVLVLLVPTVMMGATLPVMSRLFVQTKDALGQQLSRLYGLNTLGAFVGAGLAGFGLLPALGLQISLYGAAAVNVLIGLAAWWLASHLPADRAEASSEAAEKTSMSGLHLLVLAVFGLAGVASMAYQVAWTRGLILSMGSSVYAFSSILTAFLAGLGLGSLVYNRLIRGRQPQLVHLAWLQAGVGVCGALTIPILGALPVLFYRMLPLVFHDFRLVLLMQFTTCLLLLFIPTLLMGMAFPLATQLYTKDVQRLGRSVGHVYGANTTGCIIGAFITGFVLIPFMGAQNTLKAAAVVNLLLAATVFLVAAPRWRLAPLLCLLLIGGAVALPRWDPGIMAGGSHMYASTQKLTWQQMRLQYFSQPTFYQDGVSCTVSVHVRPTYLALRVNGKVDASDQRGDVLTMRMTGLLPGILHPDPKQALVIGLGSGITVEALGRIRSMEHIDCVEIEPAVVAAASYWKGKNGNILADPRVRMAVADGRTAVLASPPQSYDLIVSEPSNPFIAGIGNLYTREFYNSCRQRLKKGGLMCQWINAYALSQADLRMVLATFYDAFPQGMVWYTNPVDILLIGAEEPVAVDLERWKAITEQPDVQAQLGELGFMSGYQLLGHYLCRREDLALVVKDQPFNTDDRPILEFSAPRSLFSFSPEANLRMLEECSNGILPPFKQPPPNLAELEALALNSWTMEKVMQGRYKVEAEKNQGPPLLQKILKMDAAGDSRFVGDPEPGDRWAHVWYQRAGAALEAEEKFIEAAAAYQKAADLGPPGLRAIMLNRTANCYSQARQMEPARKLLQETVKLRPDWARAWVSLAETNYHLLDYDAALEATQKAVELDPMMLLGWRIRANAMFAKAELARKEKGTVETFYREASAVYRHILTLHREDIPAMLNLGFIEYAEGRPQAAINLYREVLVLEPDNQTAKQNLEMLTQ